MWWSGGVGLKGKRQSHAAVQNLAEVWRSSVFLGAFGFGDGGGFGIEVLGKGLPF